MKVSIYQISPNRDTNGRKFMPFKKEHQVDPKSYDNVFTGDVDCQTLEGVYTLFNTEHPITHRGHSLSVSDVIVTADGAFFCDTVGFKPITFDETQTQKPDDLMTVVMVEPGKAPYITEVQNDYKAMYRVLSGLMECTNPFQDNVVVFSNDDAKNIGMDGNRRIGESIYAGPFFIAQDNGDGSVSSLSEEQQNRYMERFQEIEDISQEEVQADNYITFMSM